MTWSSNNKRPSNTMKFDDGAVQFRLRLVCSLLSHRPVLIRNIRSDDLDRPGLHEHEASFLHLLDLMTNGTVVEINSTGTQLRFKPGLLLGGHILHLCPSSTPTTSTQHSPTFTRGVGWYIEGILPLAPFCKEPLQLTLTGITDGTSLLDPSPDYIKASILPLLTKFGIANDTQDNPPPSIHIIKRGSAPRGDGQVQFFCPTIRTELSTIDLVQFGKIKRIRGVAVSTRISPSSVARLAHAAKGLLHRLLPDVWIHTDAHSANNNNNGGGCGPSPGLSVCLTAESTEGVVLSAECSLDYRKTLRNASGENDDTPDVTTTTNAIELPEDLGIRCAAMLLEEIKKGGCVDTTAQSLALLFMCLSSEDVSRIRLGALSQYSISALRLYKEAFGVEFKVRPDTESRTVLLSCLGTGYRNMARAST